MCSNFTYSALLLRASLMVSWTKCAHRVPSFYSGKGSPPGDYGVILFENCVIHLIEDDATPALPNAQCGQELLLEQ
jgi:hypothetical protein